MIYKKYNKGFTLVEMVVAIGLFVIVAIVALGALIKTVEANKKAQSIKTSITNLNFALESMSRELRVGGTYNCYASLQAPIDLTSPTACGWTTASPTSGAWTLAFNSSKTADKSGGGKCNLIRAYYFNGKSLYKGEQLECNGAYEYYPLIYGNMGNTDTSQNDSAITFSAAEVKVVTGNGDQPYVQLHFAGSAGVKEKVKSYFDLQTTVSQRIID